jgi:malate synthase
MGSYTSMQAGYVAKFIKGSDWIKAYEDRNVSIGLACGMSGKAQIGKQYVGCVFDDTDMMGVKTTDTANTAWVPVRQRLRCTQFIITG